MPDNRLNRVDVSAVLELYHQTDLNSNEIARALNTTTSSVKWILRKQNLAPRPSQRYWNPERDQEVFDAIRALARKMGKTPLAIAMRARTLFVKLRRPSATKKATSSRPNSGSRPSKRKT